jgi:hypothetical protein
MTETRDALVRDLALAFAAGRYEGGETLFEMYANIALKFMESRDHAPTQQQWRCFHCDEVFTAAADAAAHFGDERDDEPLCKLAQVDGNLAKVIRDLQQELAAYRREDTASYREFYSLGADHARALIREEQKGYDRGVYDGRALSDTSTDRTNK